ncbi:hypothetical protein [Psittacicella hinzii]|nr:hypothetical protein [Psittacicella hinzii]
MLQNFQSSTQNIIEEITTTLNSNIYAMLGNNSSCYLSLDCILEDNSEDKTDFIDISVPSKSLSLSKDKGFLKYLDIQLIDPKLKVKFKETGNINQPNFSFQLSVKAEDTEDKTYESNLVILNENEVDNSVDYALKATFKLKDFVTDLSSARGINFGDLTNFYFLDGKGKDHLVYNRKTKKYKNIHWYIK